MTIGFLFGDDNLVIQNSKVCVASYHRTEDMWNVVVIRWGMAEKRLGSTDLTSSFSYSNTKFVVLTCGYYNILNFNNAVL